MDPVTHFQVGLQLSSSCQFREKWTTSLGSSPDDSSFYFQSAFTPVMAGPPQKRVVFVTSGSAGDRYRVSALSVATGELLWTVLGSSSVGSRKMSMCSTHSKLNVFEL